MGGNMLGSGGNTSTTYSNSNNDNSSVDNSTNNSNWTDYHGQNIVFNGDGNSFGTTNSYTNDIAKAYTNDLTSEASSEATDGGFGVSAAVGVAMGDGDASGGQATTAVGADDVQPTSVMSTSKGALSGNTLTYAVLGVVGLGGLYLISRK